MMYTRFEDLPVWQLAAQIFERCAALGAHAPAMNPVFRHQLTSVALAIPNRIAQSYELGSRSEILENLNEAVDGLREIRSLLSMVGRTAWPQETITELAELKISVESCGLQLQSWIEIVRRSNGAEPAKTEIPSPERFHRLLANLPSTHPLRRSESQAE